MSRSRTPRIEWLPLDELVHAAEVFTLLIATKLNA